MLKVFDEFYYIDLESVSKAIEIEPIYEVTGNTEQSINLVSFEVIKMMLEIIMTEREEVDENLGSYSTKNLSIPFKVAFNTLLKHQILKHL